MKFTGFSVENYKSIQGRAKVQSLESVNSFIGPNNEGKSSLLEALNLARYSLDVMGGNDTEADAFMLERLHRKSSDNLFKLTLEFVLENDDLSTIYPDNQEHVLHKIEFELSWGGELQPRLPRFLIPTRIVALTRDGQGADVLKQPDDNPLILFVSRTRIDQIFDIGVAFNSRGPDEIHRNIGQLPSQPITDGNSLLKFLGQWVSEFVWVESHRTIDPITPVNGPQGSMNSSSIPRLIHDQRVNEPLRFQQFSSIVTQMIPSVRAIVTRTENDGSQVSVRVAKDHTSPTEEGYRLDTVGAGVQEIIYLIASIWLSPPKSVIFVDEPERGLHAASQRRLFTEAQKHAQEYQKQLFGTTHSTVMAPLTEDCSVHLVTMPDESGTVVTNAQGDEIRKALGHWNLDLYNYDVVVLYDGETEGEVLPSVVEHFLVKFVFCI